jgi:predicted Zn-dependent protease
MAHELSHNILRHNALNTGSKQAEYEADALSVRLLALAGYDLDAVLPFWQSLRKRTDYGIFADGTHPGWRKRFTALTAEVAKAKEAASQPPKAR